MSRKPAAFLDEHGRVVVIGADALHKVCWVDGLDRAIPDAWTPLFPPEDPVTDMSFDTWMAEHGREGVNTELGLEDLMEGAFCAGAKSNRRAVRAGPGAPLAEWWGLSYATWLTMPRVLMEAMPEQWQWRAGALLREYSAAYPNQRDLGSTVRVTAGGQLVKCPEWILDYRHPNAAEIAKCRGEQ